MMDQSSSIRMAEVGRGHYPLVEVEVGQIDPPAERLRLGYDEGKLAELVASIPQRGLLQAPGVRRVGDRYMTVWGDHRLEAVRRLGWSRVPVYLVTATDDEAVLLAAHENLRRHDMSPVEEARLCERLYRVLGEDTDRVARELCATRDWVEQRLLMLRWPDDLLELVHQGRLSMRVARELSRIKVDSDRAYYTGYALDGGATAATVAAWARDWEMSGAARDPRVSHIPPGSVQPEPVEATLPCYFHGTREPISRLVHVWLCPEALRLFIEFRDAYNGGGAADVVGMVDGAGGLS